jgi:hypothetical protein
MPIHRAAQGECLSTIAARHGFSRWQALFDHPDNAALKAQRKSPNLLLPGDEIVVPDRDVKELECASGKVHRFKVKSPRSQVRIVLRAHDGTPHAGARWIVEVDDEEIKGETADDGLIEADVPLSATRCLVSAWYAPSSVETTDEDLGLDEPADPAASADGGDDDDDEPPPDVHYALLLGHLDPHDTVSGVQSRLRNLGFGGAVTGSLDDATRAVVLRFRVAHGLPTDGEPIDDALATKLRTLHDGESA